LEPALWCAFALVAAITQLLQHNLLPRLYNDSFQYLSAAEEFRSTQRISTSVVYFDTERMHGTIPAPLTWFPPGYPLAIAALSTIGLDSQRAALILSIASFVLVAAGIWALMRMLEPSRWAARIAVFCWLTNSHALTFSTTALSESMFAAFGLASLLFLVYANRNAAHATVCWAGSTAMAGASFWVRYAGLLWVLACLACLCRQVAISKYKMRAFLRHAILIGPLVVLFITPLLVRNIILVGDPRGGNNNRIARPLSRLVIEVPRIMYQLAMGQGGLPQLWFCGAILLAGLIGLCTIAFRSSTKDSRALTQHSYLRVLRTADWAIVMAAFLVYTGGIAVIATRAPISYSSRMFFPIFPHYIALAVCGLALLIRRIPARRHLRLAMVASVLCVLLGYTISNVGSGTPKEPDLYQRTAAALQGPDKTGRSLEEVLSRELKPGEVIAATNGQAAGYFLRHPTRALAGHPYTAMNWSEPQLRRELARYGAAHLLIFRNAELDPIIDQSPFLNMLAAGQSPSWLQVAAFNRDLYLYRVELAASGAAEELTQ
jgi:hypothetical protein